MAKKFTASSSQLQADAKFNSRLVAKFVNCLMHDGKKSVAFKVFYDAMDIIAGKISDTEALEVFETAIENVKPMLEVRSKRVGGASYQVPMQISAKRAQTLAIRWILAASRAKSGKPMAQRLSSELVDAYNNTGAAMTTRENVHRMAEANKAFAHFAW
jgi:small subunit ribosomal protein S7